MERLAREVALAALVALGASACAALSPSCEKATIVVADKEARDRIETRPGPPRTTPTGTVEEPLQTVLVREYWVKAESDGTWYRIDEDRFRVAAPKQPLEVCR